MCRGKCQYSVDLFDIPGAGENDNDAVDDDSDELDSWAFACSHKRREIWNFYDIIFRDERRAVDVSHVRGEQQIGHHEAIRNGRRRH